MCRPDGRILLLEHGRAGWDWLDGILDRGERKHLRKWGCQWNRDIQAIVAQVSGAAQHALSSASGLVCTATYGCMCWYCRPRVVACCFARMCMGRPL